MVADRVAHCQLVGDVVAQFVADGVAHCQLVGDVVAPWLLMEWLIG